MSVHWLNPIARTPRGVPTFEDATVVVAAVASIIAAPGLGGVADVYKRQQQQSTKFDSPSNNGHRPHKEMPRSN